MPATSPDRNPPRDEPIRALAPTFRNPAPTPEEPTPAEGLAQRTPGEPSNPLPRMSQREAATVERIGRGLRELDEPATRTGTSSRASDQPTEAEVTKLLIGLLALGVAGVGWLVRARMQRKLRRPTDRQARDIAGPVARILLRRLDMVRLAPDLGDALEAAAAAGNYIGDGPLLQPAAPPDPNLPAGINQSEEQQS